jgi:hypothetical protein
MLAVVKVLFRVRQLDMEVVQVILLVHTCTLKFATREDSLIHGMYYQHLRFGGIMTEENRSPATKTICETENYIAWLSDEPDGERIYHLELNNATIHFFSEEWQEFLVLAKKLVQSSQLPPR